MVDVPLLWSSGARKEAMELLRTIWTHADPQMREALGNAICAGPPADLLAQIDADERENSRDRRIFDRLTVLQRLEHPPLTAALEAEVARLRKAYPNWQAPEGEQAHFGVWMEARVGSDTRYGVDDLKALDNGALIDVLIGEQEMREGLLDSWRQLGDTEPTRGVTVLEMLNRREEPAPADIWKFGLWGLRDGAKRPELRDRLFALLQDMPAALFDKSEISSVVADILDAAAAGQPSPTHDEDFWRLFDRTLLAIELDPSNSDQPDQHDWVFLALNRSMGRLATAFFAALFARELKVGAGIPADLRPRLDALLAPKQVAHRPARIIAASRLSYLYAVDPEWAQASLIPSFDWADEQEALAAWQGYAWQPRIDNKLWLALKPHFLPMFTPKRLAQLGKMGRNLAQMLMLVGIEFGTGELPRDPVRDAIRAMPDAMRAQAVAWIASYLAQSDETDGEGEDQREVAPLAGADALWIKRVRPWLEQVWPPEPALLSQKTAEQFALAAIATDARFPEAVAVLMPHMTPMNAYYVLHQLEASTHPDDHPRATLDLINAIVAPNGLHFGDNDLRAILDRARAADAEIADTVVFRTWNDRLRVQNL